MSLTSVGKQYNGFEVISVTDVPDCASKGIYLKHAKTGLEVFHLLNNDNENLFAFAFRTPPEDSSGAPHILEHSVLCGSQKYPLKDPFIRMVNQSVKTYLNALTFPDKTVFPASSIIEADYFNLMSVYGDAVFFPNLSPEIFAQEAHHLEVDENGHYSIQGVVYNEMKGNYASFDSVASDCTISSLFPNTIYALDSGGDPLHIPEIRYEKFKAFHKKYYCPDNCLVFLSGNIPTEKQLDFLQTQFLDRLEKEGRKSSFTLPDILKRETVQPFTKPIFVEKTGPASDTKMQGATVTLNWLLGPSADITRYMECVYISEILCGHDGSPLQKALLDSGFGEDIAPQTGLTTEMKDTIMTVGLRGVEHKNIKEVERLVFKVLTDLAEKGIAKEDLESASMSVSFANREVRRAHGPYSLVLLRRVLRSWVYGSDPAGLLTIRAAFDEIKNRISADSNYIPNLIRTLFLDNNHRSLVSIIPDTDFTKDRDAVEQQIIKDMVSQQSKEAIKQSMDTLHDFQQKKEDPKDIATLPHLAISDLQSSVDVIHTVKDSITTSDGPIPLFINTEPTAGITYVDVAFPVDILDPADYPYLPLFSTVITNIGWKNLTWAQTAGLTARTCGDLGASLFTSTQANKAEKLYEDREWIFFRVKMLSEKTDEALSLLSDCITGTTFEDKKRLQDLANEHKNSFVESVIPDGHIFVLSRSTRTVNHSLATEEIWSGLAQLYTAKKLADSDMKELGQKFTSLFSQIKNAGCVIHVTTNQENREQTIKALTLFAKNTELKPITKQKTANRDQALYALTALPGKNGDTDICTTQTQVGFAALTCKASAWGKPECAAELVLAHWLSNTLLWEQLRTIGGAYGAFASVDSVEQTFSIATYRDPTPQNSLAACKKCLDIAAETHWDIDTVHKAITGTYSHEVQPRSPVSRGTAGFLRMLYGITDADRQKKLAALLAVTPEQVHEAANRIKDFIQDSSNALLCNQTPEIANKATELPL